MFKDFSGYTGVIIGTGPSLSKEQLEYISNARREDKCRLFGGNNAYQVIDLDVLMSCNIEWWDYYMKNDPKLSQMKDKVDMWTWDKKTANKYKINHIEGIWKDSLSTDPKYIHAGHSTGYQVLGIAYHYNIRNFILVGYDMKYPSGYDGKKKIAGGDRHYFGEYPKELQHWPRSEKSVDPNGNIIGLINIYKKINCKELNITITNSSPDSALTCFPQKPLEEVL